MTTIDTYTKAVLTVIAGCLLWICATRSMPAVQAQQPSRAWTLAGSVQPVVIVGTGTMNAQGVVTLNSVTRAGARVTDPTLPVSAATPLPVQLPYSATTPMPAQLFYSPASPLPVEITGIKKARDWEPIRTEVEDAPVRRTPGR